LYDSDSDSDSDSESESESDNDSDTGDEGLRNEFVRDVNGNEEFIDLIEDEEGGVLVELIKVLNSVPDVTQIPDIGDFEESLNNGGDSEGISTGIIVAIAFGAIIGSALIAGVIIIAVRKSKTHTEPQNDP